MPGIRFPRHVAAVNVLDVFEAEMLERFHGFATAESARAVNQHRSGAVERAGFRREVISADGDVHRTGQCSAGKLPCGAHVKHLRFRMITQPCIRLPGAEVSAQAPRPGLEQTAVPTAFKPVPPGHEDRENDHNPGVVHDAAGFEGSDCFHGREPDANSSPRNAPYKAPRHQVEVSGHVPELHWPKYPSSEPSTVPMRIGIR